MSLTEQSLRRFSLQELEKLLPVVDEATKRLVAEIIENKKAGRRRGGFSNPELAKKAGEKGRETRYSKSKDTAKSE